jgi:hypothetical protein
LAYQRFLVAKLVPSVAEGIAPRNDNLSSYNLEAD